MARVQLIINDKKRSCYLHQARKEGLTLSAWLRAAADERIERSSHVQTFESISDLEDFFAKCGNLDAQEKEPDWDQHLAVIDQVRSQGATNT